jgi:hypothetical protein
VTIDIERETNFLVSRVDVFINALPEPLGSMGRRFATELFPYRTIFINNVWGFPGLQLPFWIADCYIQRHRLPEGFLDVARDSAQAALFGYLYIRIQDDLYDFEEGSDPSMLLLGNQLMGECFRIFRRLSGGPAFWDVFDRLWLDFSQATAWEIAARRDHWKPFSEEEILLAGKKLSFAKAPVAIVALQAGGEGDLPVLFQMMDRLAASSQLLNNLEGLRKDLRIGGFTYPLSRIMNEEDIAAGGDLVQAAFGRLLKNSSLEDLMDRALDLDDQALEMARKFPVPPLADFIKRRRERVGEARRRYLEIKLESLTKESS